MGDMLLALIVVHNGIEEADLRETKSTERDSNFGVNRNSRGREILELICQQRIVDHRQVICVH